jgi:hypothetical protein
VITQMGQSELQPAAADPTERADDAWVQSLRELLLEVIASLPDHATLGELIAAIRSNPAMSPVLDIFTVQELIDAARKRAAAPPKPAPASKSAPREVQYDAEGNPVLDLGDPGALVIRRRADVPDGDIRVLRCLSERGPLREAELTSIGGLTSEQLRILLRNLKSKGFVHVEGTGLKRRLKITRQGAAFLRKQA